MCGMTYEKLLEYKTNNQVEAEEEEGPPPNQQRNQRNKTKKTLILVRTKREALRVINSLGTGFFFA